MSSSGVAREPRGGPAMGSPAVWLLQDGEPLPTDDAPRLMRTGDQAEHLAACGFDVTWWTSTFDHKLKQYRGIGSGVHEIRPGYRVIALDGPSYSRNLSLSRVRHYRTLARQFTRRAVSCPEPDLVVGSYPSPELCEAGQIYASARGIPFVVDIRDPWPDIFEQYLPAHMRWALAPVQFYYRQKIRRIAASAAGIVAVSRSQLEWGVRYAMRDRGERDKVFYIGSPPQPREKKIAVPVAFTISEPLRCLFHTTCGLSYDGQMLVEAARILEERGERTIRVVITGDGDMRAAWMRQARGLDSVEFTGWISGENMQEQFDRAHLGLILMRGGITAYWLGNKIFEYLSASLGVINNVPGEAAELVRETGSGITVRPKDPHGLADALGELVRAPQRVRRLMENAKACFERRFRRDGIMNDYVEYLRSVARTVR